jgi:hypothetical protein
MLRKCPDLNGCDKKAPLEVANGAKLLCVIRSQDLFVLESWVRNQLRVAIRSRERGKWRGRSVPECVAPTNSTVLILGETGTGKSW